MPVAGLAVTGNDPSDRRYILSSEYRRRVDVKTYAVDLKFSGHPTASLRTKTVGCWGGGGKRATEWRALGRQPASNGNLTSSPSSDH